MKVFNYFYQKDSSWQPEPPKVNLKVQLVLCFGEPQLLYQDQKNSLSEIYPNAQITGCTTAGSIHGTSVHDDCITVTAIEFDKTEVAVHSIPVKEGEDSFILGRDIGDRLIKKEKLKHVIVITDGLLVKGDNLSAGISQSIPSGVAVTGGMAGQGTEFEDTRVWLQESGPVHQIVAIGLYGDNLEISYGSQGGFDSFGPKRKITRSKGNVLYELDGQSALELYKSYLGESADELPASGLHFPLMLTRNDTEEGIVRTIQGVDETDQSMEFAGNLPEGAYVQLMRSNYNSLIDGAYQAAEKANQDGQSNLALLISCVGRRVVLHDRVDEEIEDVREALGDDCTVTGFYSYGEFCPVDGNNACLLHNQTMTITTFRES